MRNRPARVTILLDPFRELAPGVSRYEQEGVPADHPYWDGRLRRAAKRKETGRTVTAKKRFPIYGNECRWHTSAPLVC